MLNDETTLREATPEADEGESLDALTALTSGDDAADLPRSATVLLQAARLAGLAAFVIDTATPEMAIVTRNERAAALISPAETNLATADRVAKMTFYDLSSHALLVAAGLDFHRGEIVLLGDALPTRRRGALMRLLPDDAEDSRVLLLIGEPVNWQAVELWSLETDGAIETILRLRNVSQR